MKGSNIDRNRLGALLLAFVTFGAASALGQEAQRDVAEGPLVLEEIVVTAQRRSQNLSDLAMSVTAMTGETLSEIGARDLGDFLGQIPNVQFFVRDSGQARITIRGVSGSQVNSSTVGYYIDDIAIASHAAQPGVTTYDIERVEVLRGPQGTLYGEGAMGGAIKFLTRQPDTTSFNADVQATFRSIESGGNGYDLDTMVNIPLVEDKAAIRAVISYVDNDGWVDAPLRASGAATDVNDAQRTTARLKARFDPTEALSITASYFHMDTETGGWADSLPDLTTVATLDDIQEDETDIYGLTVEYEFAKSTFTSTTAYRERDNVVFVDASSFLRQVNFLIGLYGLPPSGATGNDVGSVEEVFTQEFRLVSAGDQKFDWVIGAFYKDSDVDNSNRGFIDNPPAPPGFEIFDGTTNFDVQDIALYGEATFHLSDKLDLTTGLRAFNQDRTDTGIAGGVFTGSLPGTPPASFSESDKTDELTWKVNLSYQATEATLVWLNAATGFRSAGVNSYAVLGGPGSPNTFDSDDLISYELGMKNTLANGRAFLDTAVYSIDWNDYQTSIATVGGLFPIFGNDPEGAKINGIEVAYTGLIGDYWEASIGGAILDTELKSTGTELVLVPEKSGSAALLYRRPLGNNGLTASVRAAVTYQSERQRNLANTSSFESYTKWDLRFGVAGETWQAFLSADNVTDEDIQYSGGANHIVRGRPRTISVTLGKQF